MKTLVLIYLAGCIASVLLIPLVQKLAFRIGCVAKPREDRWHSRPTPLLGGLVISGVVLVGSLMIPARHELAVLLICGGVIAAIGLIDDIVSLKSSTKLLAEIVLASVLVYFGDRLHWTQSLTIDTIATIVWIVGITNALNLLDNMDGLCAGIALISAGALLAGVATSTPTPATADVLALMMGALSGFLVFNFHPARIFMGDTGALFVGLMLSGIAVSQTGATPNRSNLLPIVVAPVVVLLIPIFDTALVTLARIHWGRSPAQGGRDHSSHRLVALGLSERAAVAVLWALAAIAGTIGITLQYLQVDSSGPLVVVFVLGLVIFAVYLAGVRVYDSDANPVPRGYTVMLVDFMYKRRVAEVLLDFCLICVAYYSAYRLRFEGAEFVRAFPNFLRSLPVVIATQLAAFFVTGAYRSTWRYFGLMDAVILAKGVVAGAVAVVIGIALLDSLVGFAYATFIIYPTLLMLFVTGSRASFRLIGEFVARRPNGPRVIVYSSGQGESRMARDMLATLALPCRILGFISSEPERARGYIQGYPVLGGYDELLTLISAGLADEVVVCLADADPARLEELRLHCEASHVRVSQLRYNLEPIPRAEGKLSRA